MILPSTTPTAGFTSEPWQRDAGSLGPSHSKSRCPPEAIEAAVAVLASGRLHRYNLAPDDVGEVAHS